MTGGSGADGGTRAGGDGPAGPGRPGATGTTGPTLVGDRYELGPVIGYGGMAEVHRGVDTRLGRTVAIKLLRATLAQDETFQERFRREATASASLNHPCIISVYDTGDGSNSTGPAHGLPYIVMEFVEGRTLREVLRAGRRILPERALEIAAGMLSALDYSHRMGIVHRDIKPANVMLTPSGEVKVMDFGIARAVEDTSTSVTQTAAVIGTAQYLSPEQARGELVGPGGDIYAVGCVLYELLTGRPPFTGTSPVALALAHVRDTPDAPAVLDPEVPEAASVVTMCALAKDPADRYPGALAMREDIERALAGRPVWAASTAAGRAGTGGTTPVAPGGWAAAAVPVARPDLEETGYTGPPTQYRPPVDEVTTVRRVDTDPDGGPPSAPLAHPVEPSPGRGGRIALVVIVCLLAALLVAGTIVFVYQRSVREQPAPGPTATAPTTVAVPTLTNRTAAEAATLVTGAGLKPGRPTNATSSTVPAGRVISQVPAAGARVSRGDTVDFTVSVGAGKVVVPDVTNQQQDAAVAALTRLGLRPTPVGESSAEDSGTVLSTDPAPGSSVDPGSPVTVRYANGRNDVVDTVGKQSDVAVAQLGSAGFDRQLIRQQYSTEAPGTVLDQAPRTGTYDLTTTITLFVAVPPTPSPTPTPTPTQSDGPTPSPSTPPSTPPTQPSSPPPSSPTPTASRS